jgi:pimeloyl-ACP methyl ester carboxylesterase
MDAVPMKKFLVDDTEYYVYLKGSGPILLFAHGFPFDSRLYLPAVADLASRFTCVVPDLRGFGRTKLGANGHNSVGLPRVTMGRFADDLAILAAILSCQRRFREEKIIFCGLSMGGYISLAFAHRRPERLAGLVFCDSNASPDPIDKAQGRRLLANTINALKIPEVVDKMIPALLAPETLAEQPDVVEYLHDIMASQSAAAFAAGARGMAIRPDSNDVLAEIQVPVLVLGGEQDHISPPDELDNIAAKISNATRATIPRSGHLPPLENPSAFAKAIIDWYDANFQA